MFFFKNDYNENIIRGSHRRVGIQRAETLAANRFSWWETAATFGSSVSMEMF